MHWKGVLEGSERRLGIIALGVILASMIWKDIVEDEDEHVAVQQLLRVSTQSRASGLRAFEVWEMVMD